MPSTGFVGHAGQLADARVVRLCRDHVGTGTHDAHRVLEIVNDRIRHRADEAQALGSHHFRDEVRVHLAQPLGDGAQEIHVQPAWRELEDSLESLVVDRAEQRGLVRGGHGGTRLPIEQRHFAEEVAVLDEPERLLLAAAAGFRDFNRAFADEIKRVAGIAFAEDHLAGTYPHDVHAGRDLLQQLRPDAVEKAVVGQVVERARGFRHTRSGC
jgi:hypothetical protein